MECLGIDVGGTGIKGAIVDTGKGALVTDRYRLVTPQPARPKPVVETVSRIVEHFQWKGPIGCGFPAAIVRNKVRTASNISKRWLGVDVVRMVEQMTGCKSIVLNDADAAGIAETRFGAGKDRDGVVIVATSPPPIGVISQRMPFKACRVWS